MDEHFGGRIDPQRAISGMITVITFDNHKKIAQITRWKPKSFVFNLVAQDCQGASQFKYPVRLLHQVYRFDEDFRFMTDLCYVIESTERIAPDIK